MGIEALGSRRAGSGYGTRPQDSAEAKKEAILREKRERDSRTAKKMQQIAPLEKAKAAVIEQVESVKKEYERRWGAGRLEKLVSAELAARFASAAERYRQARVGISQEELERRAEVVKRGYAALEKAAIEAGHKPAPPTVWTQLDEAGNLFVFVRDRADVAQLDPEMFEGKRPAVWTIDEVVKVMSFAGMDWTNAVKREFFGSELTRIGAPSDVRMIDDDIPF